MTITNDDLQAIRQILEQTMDKSCIHPTKTLPFVQVK